VKTHDQAEADKMLGQALSAIALAYGVPPRVSAHWAVHYGGDGLNDGSGYVEQYDDEEDAREHVPFYEGGSVVKRTVIALRWEAVPGGGVPYPPEDRPHEEWGGCAGGHCWCGAQHSRDDAGEMQADDEARRRSELGDAWDGETHRGNL